MNSDIGYLLKPLEQFFGQFSKIRKIPIGNINESFLVTLQTKEEPIVIQRIKPGIFNLSALEANLKKFDVLRRQSEALREITPFYYKLKGNFIFKCRGNAFKAAPAIKAAKTVQATSNQEMVFLAAKTLSIFHKEMTKVSARGFKVVLRNFFNPKLRLAQLKKAYQNPLQSRKKLFLEKISPNFECLLSSFKTIIENYPDGLRFFCCHNDTKLENFLITKKMAYLIDLDCLQPNTLLLDIGDFLRTASFDKKEDQPYAEPIILNIKAAIEGLKEFGYRNFIPQTLIQVAPALISFILAVRFATDFLSNDVYFKVKHPLHNLERAETQLKRAKILLKIKNLFKL